MKKCHSSAKYPHHTNYSSNDNRVLQSKNKTISTIIHTEQQNQQQTTKKNSLNKVSSIARIGNSSCKTSKTNLIRLQARNNRIGSDIKKQNPVEQDLSKKNKQLTNQNKVLRQQFCKLQESYLKDKAKIQHLLSRMSQIKSQVTETPIQCQASECKNRTCIQKRKILQLQVHKQRIKVYELEQEKKKWDKSREQLRSQYGELLGQIQQLRGAQ